MVVGVKEQGLLYGLYFFLGLFVLVAILLGQYVHWVTKARDQASGNRL